MLLCFITSLVMIRFYKKSNLYTLSTAVKLPITRIKAWDFFSSPDNLSKITPEYMKFQVTSDIESDKIYPGQIITYQVSPVPFFTINWVTEITYLVEGRYFVDEQRFGPYKFWHHKHFIRRVTGGVEVVDKVDYKIGFGFLGDIAHTLFIKKQLEAIFTYRNEKLKDFFGTF